MLVAGLLLYYHHYTLLVVAAILFIVMLIAAAMAISGRSLTPAVIACLLAALTGWLCFRVVQLGERYSERQVQILNDLGPGQGWRVQSVDSLDKTATVLLGEFNCPQTYSVAHDPYDRSRWHLIIKGAVGHTIYLKPADLKSLAGACS